MKYFGSILLILSSLSLFGQQVKKVVTTYPKSKDVKEVYYVLKNDKTIKHGEYYSFYKGELTKKKLKNKNQSLETYSLKGKGTYKNNLKDGIWTVYYSPVRRNSVSIYNSKFEEGKYIKDEKVGVWKTYIEEGKIIKQFNFDTNEALPTKLNFGWKYPAQARKNKIGGLVKVKIIYDDCEPIKYEIVKDIGYGCGDAVIETLKEKRMLEKKYSIKKNECDKTEEMVEVQFKLDY